MQPNFLFFKDIFASNDVVDYMMHIETDILVILCKLEKIFPPSSFDSMEHLPIHLLDEAILCVPPQFR